MKFYLSFIGLVAMIFISCRKDRTCSCTVNTSGSITTHSQTAGVTFTVDIGFPIPPLEIIPARDTTYTNSYVRTDTYKANYEKVSKRAMNKNCPASYEEGFQDGGTTIVPGTSTVTTTEVGKKKYTCKVE